MTHPRHPDKSYEYGFEVLRPTHLEPRGGIKVRCCNCPKALIIRTKTYQQAVSDTFMAKRIHQQGWRLGRDRAHDLCADCQQRPAKGALAGTRVLDSIFDRALEQANIPAVPITVSPPTQEQPTQEKPTMQDTTTNGAQKRRQMTMRERVQMLDLLRKVASVDGDTNYCKYQDGWDDQRIATESGIDGCQAHHVRHLREQILGELAPAPPRSTTSRLAALEARVAELERCYLEK